MEHKPWCAKIIAINNQTPWNVRCDCKNKICPCGGRYIWVKTSCNCQTESDQSCYQIHHEKRCKECGEPLLTQSTN